MTYRRTRAIFIKELHHITRDGRSLALALAMPFMMLLLYGYALSLDVDHIPALIYDQDGTPHSRGMAREFQGSRFFDIHGFADSYAPIELAIDKNEILIGIVIPRQFSFAYVLLFVVSDAQPWSRFIPFNHLQYSAASQPGVVLHHDSGVYAERLCFSDQ
jgi:hypothetical protein